MSEPKWLQLAKSEIGTREIVGKKHNPKIVQYFRDVHNSWVVDDETPWCAAAVGSWLERSGETSTRKLTARSYLNWGIKVANPIPGDVVVFSRGNSSWQGHVGFFVKRDSRGIHVLGGNQGNAVSIAVYSPSRLLGYRRPAPRSSAAVANKSWERALEVLKPNAKFLTLSEFATATGKRLTPSNTAEIRKLRDSADQKTVHDILWKHYWVAAGCDRMPEAAAIFAFHTALHSGAHNARIMIQDAADVNMDGIIGPITIRAIEDIGSKEFVDRLRIVRAEKIQLSEDWDVKAPPVIREMDRVANILCGLPAMKPFGHIAEVVFGPAIDAVNDVLRDVRIIPDNKLRDVELVPELDEPEEIYQELPSDSPDEAVEIEEVPMSNENVQPKSWAQSLTIWGVIVTFVSTVLPTLLQAFGWNVSQSEMQTIGNDANTLIQALSGLFGTVMAIIGRWKASQPIVIKKS